MNRFVITTMVLISGTGCSSFAARERMDLATERLTASLFPEDKMEISNEAIAKLLSGKIEMPTSARIAVVRLGEYGPSRWWSMETARLDQENADLLAKTLKQSKRVRDVLGMPELILGPNPTVASLRASAARCQADLLLIYTANHRNYRKSRFLSGEEANCYCYVEAFLLDVRTAVVPFTSITTEDYQVKEQRGDANFSETLAKAQISATGRAVQEVAERLVAFLDGNS